MTVPDERLLVGADDWQRAAASYVRFKVFVLERQINMMDEFDSLDIPGRVYAVVYVGKSQYQQDAL